LVFDHLDADLGREGRAVMRALLRDYPGVVVAATDLHDKIMETTLVWTPGRVTGAPVEQQRTVGDIVRAVGEIVRAGR
jgi:hypothetical protein